MNKFIINENDQFDILKIERLTSTLKIAKTKFDDLLDSNECFKIQPNENNCDSCFQSIKDARIALEKRRKQIDAQLEIPKDYSGIVDLLFFGYFEYKTVDDPKYSTKQKSLAIKNLVQNIIKNLSRSAFKLSRISIMDMRHRGIWEHKFTDRNGRTGMSVNLP